MGIGNSKDEATKSSSSRPSHGNGGGGRKGDKTMEQIERSQKDIENIEKRIALLEQKKNKCAEEAEKKGLAKDRSGALRAMKRGKGFEEQIKTQHAALLTLEAQLLALESAATNQYTVAAIKAGTDAMKATKIDGYDEEQAEQIMEDAKDAIDESNQIGDAISRAQEDPEDDDELVEELERMMNAAQQRTDANVTTTAPAEANNVFTIPGAATGPIDRQGIVSNTNAQSSAEQQKASLQASMDM